jgi:lipopolysaccharide transport system permease protein
LLSSTDLRTYAPLTVNFARRELAARYKRSLLIYSLVFGVFFRTPPPVTANGRAEYFSLYLFIGLVVWGMFTGVLNGSMAWMAGVSDMRKKVYFPAETAIFGGSVAVAVQSGLEILVLAVIMGVLLNMSAVFLLLPLVVVLAGLFGLGVGLVAAILNTVYRDTQYLVGILLNLAFFLVPIVYTPEILPERAYGVPVQRVLGLHPMSSFVEAAHDIAYFQRLPTLGAVAQMLAWTAGALAVGLWYFRRRSMQISEEL